MGINKSGHTDKNMMIRGGRVETHDGHLVIEGDTYRITEYAQPQGLTHPPATTTNTEIAIPDTAQSHPQHELRTYETTTWARHIRDMLFRDGYIIHVGLTCATGLSAYIALRIYWWWLTVQEAFWAIAYTAVKNMAIVLVIVTVLAVIYKIRGGSRRGPIDIKACPRGPLGPGRWRIWND